MLTEQGRNVVIHKTTVPSCKQHSYFCKSLAKHGANKTNRNMSVGWWHLNNQCEPTMCLSIHTATSSFQHLPWVVGGSRPGVNWLHFIKKHFEKHFKNKCKSYLGFVSISVSMGGFTWAVLTLNNSLVRRTERNQPYLGPWSCKDNSWAAECQQR